jgi:hypothetical protein
LIGTFLVAFCRESNASNIYTFEAPQFTSGQATPLLDEQPNSGSTTFTTTFADAADPGGALIVGTGLFHPNPLMVGQFLFQLTSTGPLTVTFNQPVFALTVDFAINDPSGSAAGSLKLVTSSGTDAEAGSNVGGAFQGGTLSFSSATPFLAATLQGFLASGASTQLSIDNLQLSTTSVPEPSSALAVFGLLLMGLALRARKSQRES